MSEVDEARRRWRRAGERAIRTIGEDLLGEAVRRAPIEEGTLRGSADLEIVDAGNTLTAVVSFNTIYAARQHEETSWEHPLGGQAKYLESVLLERGPRYEAAFAAAMRGAL